MICQPDAHPQTLELYLTLEAWVPLLTAVRFL